MESVMRTVGPAHQFLAKPCTSDAVVDVIRRSLESRRLLESRALRELMAGLKTLPTPSPTYYALTAYMKDPKASVNGVAAIIEGDVAMTAELLKLTNSAYFAMPSRVSSPLQAVRVLGFETLTALVLRAGIFRSFTGCGAMMMEEVNRDSMMVARLARRIGRMEALEGRDLEETFCAGMLSSIGLLVLLDRRPRKMDEVRAAIAGGQDILLAETAVFGATHLQLGAYLLSLWGFNKAVVEAVALSGRPGAVAPSRLGPAGAVHLARVLAGPLPPYAESMVVDQEFVDGLEGGGRMDAWVREAAAELSGEGKR
ncbi:MAG TPA: HDOD domain-containing protein, partial [Rhodospirillaceae bacterium]|nr:HDOD domain-containing protein [Rhodospirillaceae bacterium]